MTGKLIKYETKSSMKLMAVIWAALIATSLLFSLSMNVLGSSETITGAGAGTLIDIIEVITGFMYISVFVALAAATVIIVIMRFYKGLLGDEGYLMHTLPVKPWQLITSKGIVAAIVVIVSIIVAMLSVLIVSGLSSFTVFPDIFKGMAEAFREEPKYILMLIELLVVIVLSVLKSIYQVYASLAIGQLAGKYRILVALAAYIGLSTAVTVLFLLLGFAAGSLNMFNFFTALDVTEFGTGQIIMAAMFGLTAIQLVAFHVITERILSLKLNLQ